MYATIIEIDGNFITDSLILSNMFFFIFHFMSIISSVFSISNDLDFQISLYKKKIHKLSQNK